MTDLLRVEWASEALPLATLALTVFLLVRYRRFFQFLDTGHSALRSCTYKGYHWTSNAGFNGVVGPYYRAEMAELLAPDGTRLELPEFDECIGVGEVAATQKLDRIVREWIDRKGRQPPANTNPAM